MHSPASPRTTRKSVRGAQRTPQTTQRSGRKQVAQQGVCKQKRALPKSRYSSTRDFCRSPAPHEHPRDKQGRLNFYCNQKGSEGGSCTYVNGVATNFRKHLKTIHQIDVLPEKPMVIQAAERAVERMAPGQENTSPTPAVQTRIL